VLHGVIKQLQQILPTIVLNVQIEEFVIDLLVKTIMIETVPLTVILDDFLRIYILLYNDNEKVNAAA
jgi:hypothetical protein